MHTYFADMHMTSFFVQTKSSTPNMQSISFEHIFVNDGGGFNNASNINFQSPRNGTYWFVYTVVWNGETKAKIEMLGTSQHPPPQVERLHEIFFNYDVVSSSSVHSLTQGHNLSMFTSFPIQANDTTGSSWGAFILDILMSPLVLFEVTGLTLQNTEHSKYDIVNFNVGYAWSKSRNVFVAKMEGIYYFSATILVSAIGHVKSYFIVNRTDSYCIHLFLAQVDGSDTVSRGCLLFLNKYDYVTLGLLISEMSNSVIEGYFRGFLYSPHHGLQAAWSLHNDHDFSTSSNAIKFPRILLHLNVSWNSSEELIIVISGVYFIEIVGSSDSYATNQKSIDMCLELNRSAKLSVLYFASNVDGVTRSRSLIIHLNIGDKLRVISLGTQKFFMSGYNFQGVSFQGFLLYPAL